MTQKTTDQRRPADETYENWAQEMMRERLSPEEYAARHAHQWVCFSMDECQYRDPEVDAWITRLGDIFFQRNGAPTVRELRERFLTPEERRHAEEYEREL